MSKAKRHTLRFLIDGQKFGTHGAFVIDCPWDTDDPERDCRMREYDGTPVDACALTDWLDGGGIDAIGIDGRIKLSVSGRCEWRGNDFPTFVIGEHDE